MSKTQNPKQTPTALNFCVSSQTWDINQGQEGRHTPSRASRPFPWFPATIALEGSGLGGSGCSRRRKIAAEPRLGMALAGSGALQCAGSLYGPAETRMMPCPFGARCCAEGGGSPEGWDGISSLCPAQAARGRRLLPQQGAQHRARCCGRVAQLRNGARGLSPHGHWEG